MSDRHNIFICHFQVSFPKDLISWEEDWTITIIKWISSDHHKIHGEQPSVLCEGFDLSPKVTDDTAYRSMFFNDHNILQVKKLHNLKATYIRSDADGMYQNMLFLLHRIMFLTFPPSNSITENSTPEHRAFKKDRNDRFFTRLWFT